MIDKSTIHNPNYLAKLVRLPALEKHPNADRLQIASIDFNNVILGDSAREGELYVYFPVESVICNEILFYTNSFRHSELNANKEVKGFFEDNGRVRAVKLRGMPSAGYMVPAIEIEKCFGFKFEEAEIGQYFDAINGVIILKKYEIKIKEPNNTNKQGKKPRISRLIDGQFHLHVDTQNLRQNAYAIKPEDDISITYKYHGTSAVIGNVLVKRKLSLRDKIAKLLGVHVEETEYDYVYASRRVVKNEHETSSKQHFYDTDIWGEVKDEIKDKIPCGYTVYGEIVGFLRSGAAIQAGYDYACGPVQHKFFVYRVTITSKDGIVTELSTNDMIEFCKRAGLEYVETFYVGKAGDLFPKLDREAHWNENFIKELTVKYNDKRCHICANNVPEEGIVLRKESLFNFEAYKLKSWTFLEYETAQLDKGDADIESIN